MITSDDVFDSMLNLKSINQWIDRKHEEIFEDYLDTKYFTFQVKSLDNYEQPKKVNATHRYTQSKYARKNLLDNVRAYYNFLKI